MDKEEIICPMCNSPQLEDISRCKTCSWNWNNMSQETRVLNCESMCHIHTNFKENCKEYIYYE